MKKIVFKLFVLLAATYIVPVLVLLAVCPQYTRNYAGSFVDKMKRLESVHEPKITIVGNSNVAFGIQSDLIERELNMPVVNLGLHGGCGNAFHERMASFNINKGDIIVISHLDYFDDDSIPDPELALITVENHFHFWRNLFLLYLRNFHSTSSNVVFIF